MNFLKLSKIIESDHTTFEWCMQNGLLSQSKNCPACKAHIKKIYQ